MFKTRCVTTRWPVLGWLVLSGIIPRMAWADASIVQVSLSKSDVGISFVESGGGMTVELKCEAASVRGRLLYIGDGAIALPLSASSSGILLQGKTKYKQGDQFPVGATVRVLPGYKSVRDLPRGSVYVVLPGVTFTLPELTENGRGRVHNLEPSSSGFRSLAFRADGTRVAVSSIRDVRVVDVDTGQRFAPSTPIRPGSPVGVAFAPDGNHVATTGRHGVHLWNVTTGKPVLHMPDHAEQVRRFMAGASATSGVCFSSDGSQIATAGRSYLTIWENGTVEGGADGNTKIPAARLHRRITVSDSPDVHVTQVVFGPHDRYLVTASRHWRSTTGVPRGLQMWNVETGECVMRIVGGGSGLAISPDGTKIASQVNPESNRVGLWEIPTGNLIRTLDGARGQIQSVAFDPTGKFVAAGSQDGTIRVWDVATGRQTDLLDGHLGAVDEIAWSPVGDHIASVCSKPPTQLIVWDTRKRAIGSAEQGTDEPSIE